LLEKESIPNANSTEQEDIPHDNVMRVRKEEKKNNAGQLIRPQVNFLAVCRT